VGSLEDGERHAGPKLHLPQGDVGQQWLMSFLSVHDSGVAQGSASLSTASSPVRTDDRSD